MVKLMECGCVLQTQRKKQATDKGRSWGGQVWVPETACDMAAGQGIRFTAALILRNLARQQVLKPQLQQHEVGFKFH